MCVHTFNGRIYTLIFSNTLRYHRIFPTIPTITINQSIHNQPESSLSFITPNINGLAVNRRLPVKVKIVCSYHPTYDLHSFIDSLQIGFDLVSNSCLDDMYLSRNTHITLQCQAHSGKLSLFKRKV
jgi:hypothetical protein